MSNSKTNHLFSLFSKAASAFVLLSILSACGDNGIKVTTEFRNSQDVKEGTKVYFEERKVGEVIKIEESTTGSLLTLSIDQESSTTIDPESAVVVNRIKPGAPLEIHSSAASNGLGLQEGQQLQGLNSMLELVTWSLGDAMQVGAGELAGYVDSFGEYLQGEQFQADRARVEAGVIEMAAVASDAMKTVEQDLAAAMSEVSVSEEELAAAILELGDELSPIAEEMAKSGTDLMAELEKFTQGLDSATLEEQVAGQKFIDSLIETIEKLNSAAERGVESSVNEAQN